MSSTPPDLKVLCRKLTTIAPPQLLHSLPSLVNHVLRCREPLSAASDPKVKNHASERKLLVHKLKTNITTLLNGRSREGRLVAVALIKAAVDVGGWETLHGSGPWVRGLLSIVQKNDPVSSKELAIITLTRIYMLLHPYATLVREIATPTIPDFVTSCLQVIKDINASQASTTGLATIESICDAFSTLLPLYSTTFRPFSSKIRTAVRSYIAPTCSDTAIVPLSLRRAARRIVISLHHVAVKSGGADEWNKAIDDALKSLHATANQVLRAVVESWEGSNGQVRSQVSFEGQPQGGGSSPDEFPPWSGLPAGSDRLTGLFELLAEALRYPTKSSVTIPIGALMDAVSRVCVIARLSPKTQAWDQALQTNPAIGREEKEELWSAMPSIHTSALELILALVSRLQADSIPLLPEALDHLVRVFKSGIDIPSVRTMGYQTLDLILPHVGLTLTKPMVEMLSPLLRACCRDLQEDAGIFKAGDKPQAQSTDSKKNGTTANADLFLSSQPGTMEQAATLEPSHKEYASQLLATALAQLPQQNLKASIRSLLDRTAILTRNRDAMVASVLNPYKESNGRSFPSILPHLTQQYPHDQALEILRTNLRMGTVSSGEQATEELDHADFEEQEDEGDDAAVETAREAEEDEEMDDVVNEDKPSTLPTLTSTKRELPSHPNPFEPGNTAQGTTPAASVISEPAAESPPKRKHEDSDGVTIPAKRQEVGEVASSHLAERHVVAEHIASEGDDSSDESVHLNMELEDDDEEEEEEDV